MRILLAVDLQKQFRGAGYEACLEWIEKHRGDYDKVVATLFVNDENYNQNFIRKLGWKDCAEAAKSDIEFEADQIFIKHSYGLPWGVFHEEDQIDVLGAETDAGVLAVCFSLWDDGMNFRVLWDYVYTSADIRKDLLEKIYVRQFGKNVLLTLPPLT